MTTDDMEEVWKLVEAVKQRNHALFLLSSMCRRMRANRFVGDQEFMDTLAMAKKLVEEKQDVRLTS